MTTILPRNLIAREALQLLARRPGADALAVLDEVMQPHRGTSPDLDEGVIRTDGSEHMPYCDHLEPAAPFAALVARAFGQLDPTQWGLLVAGTPRDASPPQHEELERRWEHTRELFAQRYELWSS